MKPKTMILMFVAIGCGLAASYMTSRVIAERNTDQADVEKITVLVAKKNIGLGTLIKDPEAQFEEKSYVKGEEPKKAIRVFEQLKDKRLNKPIAAEQFVTDEDLFNKENSGLESVVKPGMRAYGLKVNVESSGGGFVLPHSRVDLVHVAKRESEGKSEITSRIIMQDVLVLAVDQAASKPEDKNSLVPQTVVVEVTPKQAEALSLATDIGSIRLILRGFGDDEKVSTLGVNPKGIQSNGEGKSDDSEDLLPAKETSSKLAGKIPDVPDGAAVPEVKAPVGRVHILRILVGDTATSHQYVLNANNEVILPENAPANDEQATPNDGPAPKKSEPATSDAPKVKKGYKPAAAPPAAKTAPQGASASYQDAPLPGISSPKN